MYLPCSRDAPGQSVPDSGVVYLTRAGRPMALKISGSDHDQMTSNQDEKKKELFQRQKQLLDTFLEHGAISREQYDKSLGDLIVKMGIREDEERMDG